MQKIYLACYSFLLAIVLFSQFFRPITAIQDDLGRHLLLGNIIVTTHTVPKTNLLSYTFPDYPFLNTSWFSEVVFFLLVQYGGFFGLLSTMTAIALLACFLQVLFVKKHVSLPAILLTGTLYIPLLMLRSDIRPELFSMLFLSLFITTLYTFRQKPTKRIFFLILFELLWVNMHIYFFIGPFLVFLFFLEDAYHHHFKKTPKTILYTLTFLGTVLVTLCNPNGIHGSLAPFTLPLHYGMPVVENQNIYTLLTVFYTPGILYPLFVVLFFWLLLFFQRKQTLHIDWVLAVFFGIAALVVYRNILLFTFLTFIPFTFSLNRLLLKLQQVPKAPLVMVYPMLLLVLLALFIHTVHSRSFGFGVQEEGKAGVDFLKKHHIKGPVLNDFNNGGYLSYKLYPQKVYVDNRPEAYPKTFFTDRYLPMQKNPNTFLQEDNTYRFNAIVLSRTGRTHDDPFLRFLTQHTSFAPVYSDTAFVIFLRRTPEHKAVIQQYEKHKSLYH